jgi:plasmid stabilization system protein ParE
MAKRVVWSHRAQKDRREILNYWRQRNKSNSYSQKLNSLFKESVEIIANYPQIGSLTDDDSARFKVVKHYLIFYEEHQDEIFILTIWDTRQNPDTLSIKDI